MSWSCSISLRYWLNFLPDHPKQDRNNWNNACPEVDNNFQEPSPDVPDGDSTAFVLLYAVIQLNKCQVKWLRMI